MAGGHTTTCPCCQQTFQLWDTELQAAAGLVRCGSCLKVFNSLDHLHGVGVSPPDEDLAYRSGGSNADPHDDDNFYIDDNFDLSLLGRLSGGEDADQSPTDPAAPITETQSALKQQPDPLPAPPEALAPSSLDTPLPSSSLLETNFDNLDDLEQPHRRRLPWLTLALAAALVLTLGYGHHQAPILGQDARLIPALTALCRITGCALPVAEDSGGVTTTQLVVRSHPDQRGLLRLDALLVNSAASERPLPELTLRFENLQGAVVVERHFTPHQYLYGENIASVPLAAGEALRIRLDILDPGPDAVSYSLSTRSTSRAARQ